MAGASAALLLSGCMVGPDYHRPPAPVAATFKELPGWRLANPQDSAPKGAWWESFGDPLLDRLELQIDQGNQTLREQAAAYANAQALVDEARANLFPTLTGTAGVTRSSSGRGGSTFSTGSVITQTGTGVTTTGTGTGGSVARTSYSLQGNADWTIDIWGAVRRQVENNVASAQASAALLANVRLSEQALLATDYLDLRVTDALQRVLDETVRNDTESLRITTNQYNAGVAARSDVLTAQAQLDAARSSAVNVGVARAQYEHAIAVLIGRPPALLAVPTVPSVPPVPDTPGLLPSTLLERRPDVASAERSMKAENALIGVAVAAYYPQITLSALFGYAGNPLGALISSANRVWSLGASASDAIFQGGARTAAVRAARASYDESVATYRQTVLTAFQQVEDALSGLRILAQQAVIQRQAVADAQHASQIALNEYRAGTQAYTAVITAQNTLLSAQQTELSIEESRLTDAVALIQALGGGWRTADLPDRNYLQRRNPLLP
jgi:NodT family efflux transporter outer membrane factor (OMF) lipoprotein